MYSCATPFIGWQGIKRLQQEPALLKDNKVVLLQHLSQVA